MKDSWRQTLVAVGVVLMASAAVSACRIPRLWELCNTGEISGPRFLGIVAVVAALFGVGLAMCLRGRRAA